MGKDSIMGERPAGTDGKNAPLTSLSKIVKKAEKLLQSGNKEKAFKFYKDMFENGTVLIRKKAVEFFAGLHDERAVTLVLNSSLDFPSKKETLAILCGPASEELYNFLIDALKKGRALEAIDAFVEFNYERAVPLLLNQIYHFTKQKHALIKLRAKKEQLFDFYKRGLNAKEEEAILYLSELCANNDMSSQAIDLLVENTSHFHSKIKALEEIGAEKDRVFNFYSRKWREDEFNKEAINSMVELKDKRAVEIIINEVRDFPRGYGALICLGATIDQLLDFCEKWLDAGKRKEERLCMESDMTKFTNYA